MQDDKSCSKRGRVRERKREGGGKLVLYHDSGWREGGGKLVLYLRAWEGGGKQVLYSRKGGGELVLCSREGGNPQARSKAQPF